MLEGKKIIGAFEKVKITKIAGSNIDPDIEVLAKIDTGAFSGVVHAENIEEKGGILSFDLMGDQKIHLETSDYFVRKVKNTHGGNKNRYLAKFEILLGGENFEILLGVDDRTKMKFDMLIGRAFLNKYEILIDTHRNLELDKEWQEMGEKQ